MNYSLYILQVYMQSITHSIFLFDTWESIFTALICAVLFIGQDKVVPGSFYIMHNLSNTK